MSFVQTDSGPQAEPRWPALIGILSIGVLYLGLPEALTLGPNWLLLLVVAGLAVPAVVLHRLERHHLDKVLGFCESAVVTLALGWSLWSLIGGLPTHRESAEVLLRSAAALWLSNVLVFASWYWRLDAGGPHKRAQRRRHAEGAFLFPQMTVHSGANWSPGFVDYLFLAFNTSTAFSPADVAPLNRWAKMLMMLQSLISLGAIVVVGARAVNVL